MALPRSSPHGQARNRTDQILNGFGMALFLGVAAYIVYKRTVGQFF